MTTDRVTSRHFSYKRPVYHSALLHESNEQFIANVSLQQTHRRFLILKSGMGTDFKEH